jgi:hypothetical protein
MILDPALGRPLQPNPVGTNVLLDLKRKVQPLLDAGPWRQAAYILFARAGFRLVRADDLLEA